MIFGDVLEEILFLKGLVKFGEIKNVKDLKENGRLEFIFYITTGNHRNSLDL